MRRPRGEVVLTETGDVVAVRPRLFNPPPWLILTWIVVRNLARATWWCARHPAITSTVVGAVWLYVEYGWAGPVVPLAVVAVGGAVWWWRHASSWWRWMGGPLLATWRRYVVYRPAWREATTLCGLSRKYDRKTVLPRLLRVRCDEALDRLTIRMVRGQTPAQWQELTEQLAYAFGRRHARVYAEHPDDPPTRTGRLAWALRLVDRVVYRDRPTVVYVVLVRTDALRAVVRPFPVPTAPDFDALPIARREDLRDWALALLDTHVLIGGATGAGKGSVIWSIIRAVAGGVRAGLVRLWVIDPKGGMELSLGKPMFARFASKSFEAMADLLDEAVAVMRARQDRWAGHERLVRPTTTDPLIVIVVDELASLTAYLPDPELRKRIASSLTLLLSQGRSVGVSVVAALQDPRAEVVPFRNLFPTRIALALTEKPQVNMVLGDGARDRGALADQMPRWAQGVGYVLLDNATAEPIRVRFSYLTDHDIRATAAEYSAPAEDRELATAAAVAHTNGDSSANGHGSKRRRPVGPLLPPSLLDVLDPDQHNGHHSNGDRASERREQRGRDGQ
jgi:S-DNA-T family DNA segregation ATPase FtsK/SpoIIIE